jgi:hypothetical protein|tara:strand:+ start:145 stop:309 length:165 start_codon:yes stop_codon:yes gene_type:complete
LKQHVRKLAAHGCGAVLCATALTGNLIALHGEICVRAERFIALLGECDSLRSNM